MMLDRSIVAVSPASTWRVLHGAGLLSRWSRKASRKGKGFHQPSAAHHHWHVDISYVNVSGTFYYLCSVLDGFSRFIVHWEIHASMTEGNVEIILQRAREAFPQASPRIISDNGPQFIARDFKEYIRVAGMTHVRTSPGYPQSNGKIERWHGSLKTECIRPQTPLSLEDARRVVERYVEHYNTVRLHSALGYVTPKDCLEERDEEIFRERDRKLEAARQERRQKREARRSKNASVEPLDSTIEPARAPESAEPAEPRSAPAPAIQSPAATACEREEPRSRSASDASVATPPPAPRRVENLRALRNQVDVLLLLGVLDIPTHQRGTRTCFRCPTCAEYHTAIHTSANIARCFKCMKSFNSIDLVMAERRSNFLDAVHFLEARFQVAP
jgi:putative transposase